MDTDSIGVITDNVAGDEAAGFSEELKKQIDEKLAESSRTGKTMSKNQAARQLRQPEEGLLLLYPISRYSNPRDDGASSGNRRALFNKPDGPDAADIVGIAISFPQSKQPQQLEAYLEGTVGWRPVE